MITRLAVAALGLVAILAGQAATAAEPKFSILYLSRAADPAYAPQRGYTGLLLRQKYSPAEGARAAMAESRIRGRALGLTLTLEERELAEGEDAAAAVAAAGSRAVILDLPLAELEAVKAAHGQRADLILFNVRHPEDRLRGEGCAPALLHTLPSRAMLADALAQYLARRGWNRILMLTGLDEASAAAAAAFERAAGKFGLRLVDRKSFEPTNDPRRRDQNNVALMTGAAEHDVVYLADEIGDFGRYVPYTTYAPRPVVGSEGLRPLAWHWAFERFGAPQLNQRFERRAGRRMETEDWAAWAAVRAVVEAVSRTGSVHISTLRAFMESDTFSLDLYKGAPGGFRAWSGQLRQPVLLAVHNAVIAAPPMEEFLHQTNTLDTLGLDRAEVTCPARKRP